MKFTEIAANLLNEGRQYNWTKGRLVDYRDEQLQEVQPEAFKYCALGIKAREFGVPAVTLAYWGAEYGEPAYNNYKGLEEVYTANDYDLNDSREDAAARLAQHTFAVADIEGWVAHLKTLLPEAIAWAREKGYKSLLVDLPEAL